MGTTNTAYEVWVSLQVQQWLDHTSGVASEVAQGPEMSLGCHWGTTRTRYDTRMSLGILQELDVTVGCH